MNNDFVLQSQIGWDMVFRGFVTAEWKIITTSLKPKGKWIETMCLIIATLWKIWKEMWAHCNNSIEPLSRYHAQIQNNTNILNLQIVYSPRANFPEHPQQVLPPSFEEHCSQHEITEWINMYGLWQKIKDYWINVNQTSK